MFAALDTKAVEGVLLKANIYNLPKGRANDGKRFLNKFSDGVCLASGEHKVLRTRLLEHAPHTLDVVASWNINFCQPRPNLTTI